ncbi:hypothetical protein ACFFWB_24895 [Flavobacterium procerum]
MLNARAIVCQINNPIERNCIAFCIINTCLSVINEFILYIKKLVPAALNLEMRKISEAIQSAKYLKKDCSSCRVVLF